VAVRVRLFAALREVAGASETVAEPGPLGEILDELERRYGPAFTTALGVSTVLLDGTAVRRGTRTEVPDGAELAILPPVSGGGVPPP
jgi:MoaD family protein